jgi:hypothetical protein
VLQAETARAAATSERVRIFFMGDFLTAKLL